MGAIGLAIESFRTLQRQQPENPDIYAGLAASYAAMGRYDLTRTNYELALAYAPDDPALLQALASTLDKLGETEQATQVRTEIRTAAAMTAAPIARTAFTPLGVPRATAMTVKLPAPRQTPAKPKTPEIQIAPPKLVAAEVALASKRLTTMDRQTLPTRVDVALPDANVLALAAGGGAPNKPLHLPRAGVSVAVERASSVPQRVVQSTALAELTEVAPRDVAEIKIAPPALGTAWVQLTSARMPRLDKPALNANPAIQLPRANVPAPVVALDGGAAPAPIGAQFFTVSAVNLPVERDARMEARVIRSAILPKMAEIVTGKPDASVSARSEKQEASSAIAAPGIGSADEAVQDGPYLERTSLGEVALITIARPTQRAKLQARAPQLPRLAQLAALPSERAPSQPLQRSLIAAASLRWVPLRYASRPQTIAVLNAARTDGLAARTRVALVDRGWRKIAIGNALSVRQHSLVLYAKGHMHVAARLAAQFRCKAVRVASVKSVIVLLGRDAAFRRGSALRA
jgi:hypothetical protein